MYKTLFSLALTVALLTPGPFQGEKIPFAEAASFPDIKSPILLEAVTYLNEKGIIKGYPDGTFKPDQVINRAEALKIIFESRGIAVESDTNSGFPDVDANLWFAIYVTSAKKLGLIQGYADGTYKPTQFVNKAEFMKISMLAQSYYSQQSTINYELPYSDLDPTAWYIPYLGFAFNKEFVDRVQNFYPTNGMSRGEAALIIYRVAKHNENLVVEPLPYLSCETCVNGVDLSQYEWSTLSFVKIEGGKVFVDGNDQTDTIGLNLPLDDVLYYVEQAKIKYVPTEEKMKVVELFPELYARAIGINGGLQVEGDEYISWKHPHISTSPVYEIKTITGVKIEECIRQGGDCKFENDIVTAYNLNRKPYFENSIKDPFETWIKTGAAKPFIFDIIQVSILNGTISKP